MDESDYLDLPLAKELLGDELHEFLTYYHGLKNGSNGAKAEEKRE